MIPHRICQSGANLIIALSFSLFLSHVANAQQPETTAECDEGVIAEPVAMVYGDSTVSCGISPASETDRFFFSGAAGDLVRLRLVTLTDNLDPFVEIRDSTNTQIGTFNCNASTFSRCSTGLTVELSVGGDFLIIVSETGADNTGGYLLSLERITPPLPAVSVAYDTAVSDNVGPSTDTDYFQFEATAGTSVRLNAVSFTDNFDPRMQVFDPTGLLVLNGIGDGAGCNASTFSRCSFAVNLDPAMDGTYSVVFYDDDAFNSGNYRLTLWCLFGDCPDSPVPDPTGPAFQYVLTTDDSLEYNADADFYTLNVTADTTLILRGITLTDNLDPRIELRDPDGTVVVSGTGAGAGCTASTFSRCGFGFTFEPDTSGTYSILIFDDDRFNNGGYRISVFCVLGDCDGDGDTFADGDREILSYGVAVTANAIIPSTEADFYEFMGTSGDEIEITVTGQSDNFDPRIQVRDPDGALVINGIGDGGGCDASTFSRCSFSVTLMPDTTGTYSMAMFDNDGFNSGQYDLSLECIFGTGPGFTCEDLEMPPFLCADNCSAIANSDQRDTNADGYGNICDSDLTNDGVVNFPDLDIMRLVFFSSDEDADLNGDGLVNFADLQLMKDVFFGIPGPSCSYPNTP